MIAALVFMAAAGTTGGLQIKQYLRDPIGLYDEKGALVRKEDPRNLPKPPVVVTPGTTPDRLRITIAGQSYYVRSSDVMTINRPPGACVVTATTGRAKGQHLGVSKIGVRASVDENGAVCVVK